MVCMLYQTTRNSQLSTHIYINDAYCIHTFFWMNPTCGTHKIWRKKINQSFKFVLIRFLEKLPFIVKAEPIFWLIAVDCWDFSWVSHCWALWKLFISAHYDCAVICEHARGASTKFTLRRLTSTTYPEFWSTNQARRRTTENSINKHVFGFIILFWFVMYYLRINILHSLHKNVHSMTVRKYVAFRMRFVL